VRIFLLFLNRRILPFPLTSYPCSSRYGSTKPEIRREHIQVGPSKRLELNHDQWHIKAIDEHFGRSIVVPTSKTTTASGLKEACCRALDVDYEEYELASYKGMAGEPILVGLCFWGPSFLVS
jgi:hypothetical protein